MLMQRAIAKHCFLPLWVKRRLIFRWKSRIEWEDLRLRLGKALTEHLS